MSNKENIQNKSADYTGAKYSQQIYKSGSVDNIHDIKEEKIDESSKDIYWGQVEKESHYEEVQTISIILLFY